MKKLLVIAGFIVALPLALSGLVQVLTRKRQAYGSEESDTFDIVVTFGGRELKSVATEFAGGSILCAFGGVELDLRDATLDPVGAYLEIDCWCGGVDITVPSRMACPREPAHRYGRRGQRSRCQQRGPPRRCTHARNRCSRRLRRH